MDERKPTYKELLEENERLYENKRFNNIYLSVLAILLVMMGYTTICTFAKYGLAKYLIAINAEETLGLFALNCLWIAEVLIGVYLIWHFVFVILYTYEEEIEEFVKHWRKTKESIREEKSSGFNPPE